MGQEGRPGSERAGPTPGGLRRSPLAAGTVKRLARNVRPWSAERRPASMNLPNAPLLVLGEALPSREAGSAIRMRHPRLRG